MGLSLLGEILISNGHEVSLVDYAFLRSEKTIIAPSIEEVVHEFRPDVIGLSVFTYLYDECQALIDRISQYCNVPIILGGVHFTIFPHDFNDDSRISYIVRGEAENTILNLVTSARREPHPVFIDCPPPSPEDIPGINLDIAWGSHCLRDYQIQLSRGCPYNCTFCNIRYIGGRRVRPRDLEICLHQIVEAKRRYPNIKVVSITDDCPTFDKERFKKFLRMFKAANTGCNLLVDNMRANLIDEEMIQLYVDAGGINICLGVESGHPDVFKQTNKGESLEDIIRAAELVRKHNLALGLCFVIGLPGDNLQRHSYSMRLAKALKPDYVFWNMCIPWPGTESHDWYQTHGEIGDIRNFSTLIDPRAKFRKPVASSRDFSQEDRTKAWLMANMETHNYFRHWRDTLKLTSLALRYKLYRSFTIYFIKYFVPNTFMAIYSRSFMRAIHSIYFFGRIAKRVFSII
jgi:radical SAM superfamily enzyme YgiQ (UPF0313 family)